MCVCVLMSVTRVHCVHVYVQMLPACAVLVSGCADLRLMQKLFPSALLVITQAHEISLQLVYYTACCQDPLSACLPSKARISVEQVPAWHLFVLRIQTPALTTELPLQLQRIF